jgi:hypothetical protein
VQQPVVLGQPAGSTVAREDNAYLSFQGSRRWRTLLQQKLSEGHNHGHDLENSKNVG